MAALIEQAGGEEEVGLHSVSMGLWPRTREPHLNRQKPPCLHRVLRVAGKAGS